MRQSLFFARGLARGLAFGVALVLASPFASAAPPNAAKQSRNTRRQPPLKPRRRLNRRTKAPPTPEDAPPPKPDDSALATPEQKPPAAPDPAPPSASSEAGASLAATTPATAEDEASKAAHEALGRREAARLAAGRTEVGVSLSVDIGNRRFKYSDELGNSLRPYSLPIAPMLSFGLEAYPLATSDVPVLRDLGFRGRFSRAFALDSTTPEGDKIETSWTRFSGEVRERLLDPWAAPAGARGLVRR